MPVPDELLQALLDGFGAGEAVIEGHVTTAALRSSTGAFPKMPTVERPPILVPRAIRKDVKDDPFVRARDYEQAAARLEPAVREALERGERHAFVAIDLLWVDGSSLADVPLLERRRILEGVLSESYLVRISAIVRPSAVLTLVTWGALGFRDLSYRAANSRYLAGREQPDWAVARAPDHAGGRPEPRRGPADGDLVRHAGIAPEAGCLAIPRQDRAGAANAARTVVGWGRCPRPP